MTYGAILVDTRSMKCLICAPVVLSRDPVLKKLVLFRSFLKKDFIGKAVGGSVRVRLELWLGFKKEGKARLYSIKRPFVGGYVRCGPRFGGAVKLLSS